MVDEPTLQLPVVPEGADLSESTAKDRPPGGLLLVTAAVAGVLCLGGGGLALFGVLPQPGRPDDNHAAAVGLAGPAAPGANTVSPAPPESIAAPAPTVSSTDPALPVPSAGGPPSSAVVFYATCAEARAAGAAPLRARQPGYRIELDHDGDGLACEKKEK